MLQSPKGLFTHQWRRTTESVDLRPLQSPLTRDDGRGKGSKMHVARLIRGDQPPSPLADGQESGAVLRHSRRNRVRDVIEAFGRRVK